MPTKKRVSSRQMLLTELKHDLTTTTYLDITYVVLRDNPRDAVRRIRICGLILEKKMGVAKNKKRFASLLISDGTEVIWANVFGDVYLVSELEVGDYVDIVGKVKRYVYTSSRNGASVEYEEWSVNIETIVRCDEEFFHYFLVNSFESRSTLSPRLEVIYIDIVSSLRFLRGTEPMDGEEREVVELLCSPVLDQINLGGDSGQKVSELAKFFGSSEDLILKVIYLLKQSGAVVMPEFGTVYSTRHVVAPLPS